MDYDGQCLLNICAHGWKLTLEPRPALPHNQFTGVPLVAGSSQCVVEFGEEIWIAEMTTMFNSAFLNSEVSSPTACVRETTYSNQFRVQASCVLSELEYTDLLTMQVTLRAKSVLWEPTGQKNLFEKNCHPTTFSIKLLGNLSIFHANKFQLMNPDQANFVSAEKLFFFSFRASLCCKRSDSSPFLSLVHLICEESAMLRC